MVHYNGHALDDSSALLEGAILKVFRTLTGPFFAPAKKERTPNLGTSGSAGTGLLASKVCFKTQKESLPKFRLKIQKTTS